MPSLRLPLVILLLIVAAGVMAAQRLPLTGPGVTRSAAAAPAPLSTAAPMPAPAWANRSWLNSAPLALGDLQTVSSDHAPYAFDETGKLRAGPNPSFKQIANGLPGLEARLPLLFDAMVSKGRLGANKFVELTATAPAKIYNIHPRKGSIAVGCDADLAIWTAHPLSVYARVETTFADELESMYPNK